jgi:hypothetical protein
MDNGIKNMNEIYIEGTITLNDKKVKFSASNEESWFQWGNSTEILSETMPITEAIQKAINEGV